MRRAVRMRGALDIPPLVTVVVTPVRYGTALSPRPADDEAEGDNHDTQQIRDGNRDRLRGRGDFGGTRPRWTDAPGASARDCEGEASIRNGRRHVREVPGHDGRPREDDDGDEGRRSAAQRSR